MRCLWIILGVVFLVGAIEVTSSCKLGRANVNFAIRLYRKMIKSTVGENVFFSPFSISTALSMTYGGARRKTAKEMCRVLGFCRMKTKVHAAFRATLSSLNSPNVQYKLALANGAFVNTRFNIVPSFTNLLSKYYSAGFKLLDFDNDAAGSADYINHWVEDRTNNKITDLVNGPGVIGSPLVLVNTVYFYGRWKYQFNYPASTPFHVSNTKQISVEMMAKTARFRYAKNNYLQCQIVELPYEGHGMSMYILLPNAVEGLASLERKLTFKSLNAALSKLRKRRLSVGIPKFEWHKEHSLKELLYSMGIKRAFSASAANFRGISKSTPPIYVGEVIHKAFINVNQTSTEAAAATAVVFFATWMPPPVKAQFLADHPFFFLIRDKKTRSILFVGRYVK